LVAQARVLPPDSPQLQAVWQKMQRFVIHNALSVYIDHTPIVTAATDNVKNVAVVPYVSSTVDYWSVSMRQ